MNRKILHQHVPYEVSYMSLFEQYRMNIPIFAPSLKFIVFLDSNFHVVVQDRTRRAPWRRAIPPPRESDIGPNAFVRTRQSAPDPNAAYNIQSITYWLSFCDIYSFPHSQYFDSIEEMVEMMHNVTDSKLVSISNLMREFNIENLEELLGYYRRRLLNLAKYSANNPN